MDVTWTEVVVRKHKVTSPLETFREFHGDEFDEARRERGEMLLPAEAVYQVERRYRGAHHDHFMNFFHGVRTGTQVTEDAVFGYRAAAPALLCNDSYFEERFVRWDPEAMQLR